MALRFTHAERAVFAKLGRVKSAKKAAAVRENGKKGGRPRKDAKGAR